MNDKQTTIDLRLFATLAQHMPANAAHYPIEAGISVGRLISQLPFPDAEAKLIFVNGVKRGGDTQLHGGERVGIFPPVGGG